MQNLMQRWIAQFEKLLEERSGAALTVTPEITEPRPAALFLSTLTLEGPMRGLLRVAVPDEELVQFVQLAGGKPLDSDIVLDETVLAAWQNLLEETAGRLQQQLQADGDGEYTVALREMRAAGADDPVANAESAAGSEESSFVLRAGQIALRIAILTRVEAAAPAFDLPLDTEPLNAAEESSEYASQKSFAAAESDFAPKASAPAQPETDRAATAAEARAAWRRTESNFEESSPFRTHPERLDLLLDIELEATLRFGSVEMPLRKVLELGPGDVLQLDRHVQEPVELVVGDRIVARGEVVLVGGNFGLHVTEVAEPRRRLETIRCLF